jgi:hypothetical protein
VIGKYLDCDCSVVYQGLKRTIHNILMSLLYEVDVRLFEIDMRTESFNGPLTLVL